MLIMNVLKPIILFGSAVVFAIFEVRAYKWHSAEKAAIFKTSVHAGGGD